MRNRYYADRTSKGEGLVMDRLAMSIQGAGMAFCYKLQNAVLIADALNAAEERREVAKLSKVDLARRMSHG